MNPGFQDDTAKFRTNQSTAQEQLRHLIQRTSDLMVLLRAQRDVLRQRGMNLPSGSLDSLKSLKSHLEKLNNNLASTLTELKQLRALADTTSLINSSLEPAEVLNQVMDTVIRITGAERGYIALKNRETGEMEYPVRRGIDQEQMAKGELVVSKTIVNQVSSTGEAVLTDNASKDDRYQGHQSIIGFQLRSILAVPLSVREKVIGVVYCDNRVMAALFKPHDLNLLKAFANQAAVAIENARLFEELRLQVAQMTEARDLMTNIFASIAGGVITLDNQNMIMDCNPAAESILNCSRDALIGQPLESAAAVLHSVCASALAHVREMGARERLDAEPIIIGRGQRYWNVILSPLRDAQQAAQGVAMVLDDLTETRRQTQQLRIAGGYSKFDPGLLRRVDEIGGEEREISVLYSDVRGFTNFSEKLEPEVLMEIINRYLSLASDAINLYDGVVDKYMGDAVTGLFNTPLNPQEDHALRAVRAAMSMRSDLLALHEIMPEAHRLFYGIGVHSGAAVLGNIGGSSRKEFGALGDAMDLGKLLQENAEGGEVLISQATYNLVGGVFECEPLEPRKTKDDRSDFTVMYRVMRLKKRTAPLSLEELGF